MVEITKAKEGLDVLDILRLWQLQDCLYLIGRHLKSFQRKNIAKIFHNVRVELTLVCMGVKPILSEALKYLSDMFAVSFGVIGVDENVIQINDH